MAANPRDGMSLEQQRAAFAWQRLHGQRGVSSDYANLAKAAPALVMGNGLMQTLAFYQAKGKEHHKKLLEDILFWLNQRRLCGSSQFEQAMNELAAMSSERYLQATQEALAILKWIRQFAAALEKP